MRPEPSFPAQRDAYAAAWRDAEQALDAALAGAPFEVRYALAGQAAIRQDIGTPVLERHVEPASIDEDATVATAACGAARGWLVCAAPMPDRAAVTVALGHAVDRCTALALQALVAHRDAVGALLAERSVHRSRADLSALEAAWDAVTQNVLTPEEIAEFRAAIRETTRTAHARLGNAAIQQRALDRSDPPRALDLAGLWADATAGLPVAGTPQPVLPPGERPLLWMPEPIADWCLRTIATAVREDPRLSGRDPAVSVVAHPVGWELAFGAYADGVTSDRWPGAGLGELDRLGAIAVSYGGGLGVQRDAEGGLRVSVSLPAASD